MMFWAALLLALNLNTATAKELESLPGIGPSLARKIVEFREKKGGFRRVEELLAVPGISEKRWRVLKSRVYVEKKAPDEPAAYSGLRAGVAGSSFSLSSSLPPKIPLKNPPMPLAARPTVEPASFTPVKIVSEMWNP